MNHFDRPYECLCENCIYNILNNKDHRIETLFYEDDMDVKNKWRLINRLVKEVNNSPFKKQITLLAQVYSLYISDMFPDIEKIKETITKNYERLGQQAKTRPPSDLKEVFLILCEVVKEVN